MGSLDLGLYTSHLASILVTADVSFNLGMGLSTQVTR